MKKYLLLPTITVITLIAFVACNQNESEIIPHDNRKEVNFSSNIAQIDAPLTRATGTTWAESDSIGIYMFEESVTNVVENKRNIKYITELGGKPGLFTPNDEIIFFPDNGDNVRFMSYYPYTTNVSSYVYKVDVSDQSKQSAIDLLYSFDVDTKYNKTVPGKKVPLLFDHKLTKININIKPGNGLDDDDIINTIVSFDGFNTQADFNLISGELSNADEPETIISLNKDAAADGYTVSYESIVIPVKNPSAAKIIFDLNNEDTGNGTSSDLFLWKFPNDVELQSGFEYIYNVTINRSGIVVEATINEWKDGGFDDINAE